jgi:DNA-binding XRE family transcriptional regulator
MDLKIYRVKNSLSNKELADELGISKTYLSLIYNGTYKPSAKLMVKIIEFTNGEVEPNSFFQECLEKNKLKQAKKLNKSSIPQDGSGFIDENVTKTFEKTNKNDLHQENVLENV